MSNKLIPLFLLVTLLLAACGAASSGEAADVADAVDAAVDAAVEVATDQSADGLEVPEDMTLQSLLAAGTLSLDETDYPITVEQAQEMLVLWKAVNSLESADNVTNEEIQAIYTQIEEAFSADQMAAIESMDLSEMVGQFGGGPGGGADLSEEELATLEAQRESGEFSMPEGMAGGGDFAGGGGGGGMSEGGGPGGGGGFGGDFSGFAGSGSSDSTDSTSGRQGGGLISQVIRFLEERAAQ